MDIAHLVSSLWTSLTSALGQIAGQLDVSRLLEGDGHLWSPLSFSLLIALATVFLWWAFSPARPVREVRVPSDDRLSGRDVIEDLELRRSFAARVLWPLARRFLRLLGALVPSRSVESTRLLLLQAGEPGGLTPLDFWGLRLLGLVVLAVGYFLLASRELPFMTAVRNMLLLGALGFFAPHFWLSRRARRRRHEIGRALPDALDMLTIGVEAGLAFESALVRVGEQWDNALTRELRRAVTEMRVGTPQDVALWRMVDRAGVQDLRTFVATLIQSTQLGVSIAQVLHVEAAQMRVRRQQRAEELARQAGIKMVFPLALFVFPSMLVVILGPSVPAFMNFFAAMGATTVSGGLP